jgi:signal transduction histidine kinase
VSHPDPTPLQPPADTSAPLSVEATYLERLDWLISLHVTAGLGLWATAIAQYLVAPMPSGVVILSLLFVALMLSVACAAAAVRRWRTHRWIPIERFYRRVMNVLAAIDLVVLAAGALAGGGADAPGLEFCVVPLVVYGSFLPRRDVQLHALFLAVLLGAVLHGQYAGWLPRACPPIPGYVCATGSAAFACSRYLTIVTLAGITTYLTAYLGSAMQAQEARAREVGEAWHQVATLRAQFVAHASHEFRTPLAVILATTNGLRRYGDRMTAAHRSDKFDRIEDTIGHMTNLLDSVLLLGRSESGLMAACREPVDLRQLGRQSLDDAAVLASPDHRLKYEVDLADPIAVVDPVLVRQALSNLLSNAVKYSPNGGRITLSVRREANGVRFEVDDEGIGIAAGEEAAVFQPFARASNVGTIPGSGLGLAIIRRAVDLMDGTIVVRARPERGTHVELFLPVPTAAPVVEPAPRLAAAGR